MIMKFNLNRILKLCAWFLVFLLILSSESESALGRKRGRRNKKRLKGLRRQDRGSRQQRQHKRRSSTFDDIDQDLLRKQHGTKYSQAISPHDVLLPIHPGLVRSPVQKEVDEWREATIQAHSSKDNETILHESVARISHHSSAVNLSGRLIHVMDGDMRGHYGCSGEIGNKKDLPTDRKWIALVKRGKCRFFNKIRLARLHDASAIIIYNHHNKAEVMNSAGTDIMSMMISSSDGNELVNLAELKDGIDVRIKVSEGTRTNPVIEATTTVTSHKPSSGAIQCKEFLFSFTISLILTLSFYLFGI